MGSAGRVLVVEDHENERRAISQILKSEGFVVFGAENADKAQGYIDENIDIVISDLNMGDEKNKGDTHLFRAFPPGGQREEDGHFDLKCQIQSFENSLKCSKGPVNRGERTRRTP
jgi:CheY-like chemotaxis protein